MHDYITRTLMSLVSKVFYFSFIYYSHMSNVFTTAVDHCM